MAGWRLAEREEATLRASAARGRPARARSLPLGETPPWRRSSEQLAFAACGGVATAPIVLALAQLTAWHWTTCASFLLIGVVLWFLLVLSADSDWPA